MDEGKRTMKRKAPKPRNPFVQHLVVKKQGAHVKSAKARRARDKAQLKREAAPAPVQKLCDFGAKSV
jgi:hypothetical protein